MVVVSKNPRRADRLPKKKRRLDHKISVSEDESILEEQEEPNILHDAEMKEFSEDESDSENETAEDKELEKGEEFLEDESDSEYETADDEEQGEGHGSRQDTEMEELEKEYSNLRNQELDLLKNLKRHKDDDLLKGQAVKNQKVLWDKALELRFLLQKAFSSSNKLPQEPLRSSFLGTNKAVDEAYSELVNSSKQTLDSLLELQEVLLEKNPSIAEATNGNIKGSSKDTEESKNLDVGSDAEWSHIYQMHLRIAPFRNKSIDKWQRKTQVTTGVAAFKGNLKAFNQNISEQVADYMRNPRKMLKSMQLHRSTVGVLGSVPEAETNVKEKDVSVGGDPELLDDSEFYQQLLKEFFETFDVKSSETALYALKRLQTKKRKIVDRRASKSRKIRYHVHEKIVNFMAPEPMKQPPMAPKLFENLFGLKNQQPASVA
ncbi:putative uncharacterized protein DDB_G0270496 isoform X2 [Macadamia integrifolia]|uniref:putative uncharacterized protein DDB_G0270496 isoform X2 n=1 Tax=Macadamia integrifolia TaxID=60698 RepID=UPI001C4FEA84|nr:putative uncharacterized protein DDB_G0270496 isoform X2 [Macadamia integrifolia]XP_042501530.1 putative uncharacterized protein DDB_G0270496 isoform X2 [Macadamia integrifolia]